MLYKPSPFLLIREANKLYYERIKEIHCKSQIVRCGSAEVERHPQPTLSYFCLSRSIHTLLWKKDISNKGVFIMFEMKFKIVQILENGGVITHYLKGKPRDVKLDILDFKKASKKFEMFGKEGMIVWM